MPFENLSTMYQKFENNWNSYRGIHLYSPTFVIIQHIKSHKRLSYQVHMLTVLPQRFLKAVSLLKPQAYSLVCSRLFRGNQCQENTLPVPNKPNFGYPNKFNLKSYFKMLKSPQIPKLPSLDVQQILAKNKTFPQIYVKDQQMD